MPGSRAVARHGRAGRVEAVRVAVRCGAPPGERSDDGRYPGMTLAEAPLVPGTQRLGPVEVAVALEGLEGGAGADVGLAVSNASGAPVWVEALVVGFRWHGAPEGSLRYLRHGYQSWSFCGSRPLEAGDAPFPSGPWLRGFHHGVGAPPADRAGWHESDLLSVVGPSAGGPVCGIGVLERGTATGLVYLRREAGGAVAAEAELRLEVPLAPGETRRLESVQVRLGEEAVPVLEALASAHGAAAGARTGASFQAGFCTWYHFFHEITEEALLRNLDALAARRSEIPIDLVQLDDGYQRAIGDWLETAPSFPSGLPAVARAIREAGFRAGLWTAPFCVVPESRLFAAHPEWLLRRGDDLHRGLPHPVWSASTWVHVLDTSRAEVRDHLRRTFAALREMGFTYQKLDFLYTASMEADAHDPAKTRAERLREGLLAVREGAGEESFLLGCGCPLGPAVGVVDGMRIGPDVAPHWEPAPAARVPGIEATVPSTRSALRSIYVRAFQHRRLWLNDPDCLMARTRETQLHPDEVESLATAIGVTGGMTVFSDDVAALDEPAVARIARTVALAREIDAAGRQGVARPVALLEEEMTRGAAARGSGDHVTAFWNAADAEASLEAHGGPPRVAPHATHLVRAPAPVDLAVFCDFDGTFAVQDVGSTLAKRHAAERRSALWKRLERGELDAWSYNLELLDGLALPEETLEAFLRTVELSPGAGRLVAWCEERGVPFRVLSDGFDRNLDRIQELTGVRFAYDSNRLWYERGRWRIAAGHPNPACGCGTGTCKRARIDAFRAAHPGATLVHVGNGRVSDLCGSETADVVFAKDTLAEELAVRGTPFRPFTTLDDVVEGLEALVARV